MTTTEHFDAALNPKPTVATPEGSLEAAQKAAQKAAKYTTAYSSTEPQAAGAAHEKTPGVPGFAASDELLPDTKVAGTGFEPVTSRL